jgi:hypothetical protein
MVRGQPKTVEVIPLADFKASINKAAYAFTEKHFGPNEEIGNKGGSLPGRRRQARSNVDRAFLRQDIGQHRT